MAGQAERGDGRLDAARYRINRMARDDQAPGEAEEVDNAEVDVDKRDDPETDAGQSMMEARAHYVEIAIQQSMRRGDFDNLPGAGKPLADLEHNDPDWWIKRKIQRENITGLGPPALTLRTEDADLDARLDACHTPQAVREVLDDFNARVIDARRQLQGGPPVVTPVRDIDEEIERWNQRRAARRAAVEPANATKTQERFARRERPVTVFSRPLVARTIARGMQTLTRAAATRMTSTAQARLPEFPGHTERIVIPTTLGDAAATVYWPSPRAGSSAGVASATSTTSPSAPSSARPPAVHINLHGGGYVLDIADMDDPLCRAVASASGAVVLNVSYVVAPQHPFPAAAHQVYEVVRWVAANGTDHGWDGTRLTLGGQSAGGGLAAAAARLALEEHWPGIALQVLHYPPLDLSMPASAKHSALDEPALRPWAGEVYDTAYVPDRAARTDRLVSPAGIADTAELRGMSPAVVIAAERDILRDEAFRYADRLDAAGALVEYHEVAGADHGYDLNDDALARASYAFIAEHVRRATA